MLGAGPVENIDKESINTRNGISSTVDLSVWDCCGGVGDADGDATGGLYANSSNICTGMYAAATRAWASFRAILYANRKERYLQLTKTPRQIQSTRRQKQSVMRTELSVSPATLVGTEMATHVDKIDASEEVAQVANIVHRCCEYLI